MSWLKTFGQKVLKDFEWVLGVAAKVLPFVGTGATIAEAALPMYAPAIAAGADVLTVVSKYVVWLENNIQSFLGNASTLEQRLVAISAFASQAVQQWFSVNFPGTAQVQDKVGFQNGIALIGRGVSDILASLSSTSGIAAMSTAQAGGDALTLIVKYVQWAEFTGAALLPDVQAGAQKAASIAQQSEAIIMDWIKTGLAGAASVADQVKFQLGVSEIQNGAVALLNSLKPTVQTQQVVKA